MLHRAVVVGCGAMSRVWLDAAAQRSDVEIVGLVDRDEDRARETARSRSLATATVGSDLTAVLAATNPDVVFDIVVPEARAEVVETALTRGCHVLSEKPMAANLDEARRLAGLARAAGKHHVVVQNRRFIAPVRRIRSLVASGAVGAVTSLHCDFFIGPHFGGFREEMDHILLLDMAVHAFDAARALSGEDAVSVMAEEWDPASSWFQQGSSAVAAFRMRSGALFSYRGSWCAEGLQTSWEGRWRIVGTKGSLVWDGHDAIAAEIVVEPAAGVVASGDLLRPTRVLDVPDLDPDAAIGGHAGVMRSFFEAIESGRPAETDGASNLATLAMVLSAIESARTGRRIEIET
ncbi:Gfo/Idh/MocA family protein [Aureimonas pseudogalii]|uniref:Putative dehydrogenase n=1 Tax=Aureimonas pseudogalii TaxID=1744844 RepID=A0A7W6H992_9HYPH|nr:Gfo/Idh/MocA family oxidoreductase [Aureimonas pseudogalii]MBB4000781.1 putative dehydrogenase [Aureimonas pseudogalii]